MGGWIDRLTDRSNLTDCIRSENLATETHVRSTRNNYKRNKLSDFMLSSCDLFCLRSKTISKRRQ